MARYRRPQRPRRPSPSQPVAQASAHPDCDGPEGPQDPARKWFFGLYRHALREGTGGPSRKVREGSQRGACKCEHGPGGLRPRSEEHTSELQSLMRISYAVFCLKKKNKKEEKDIEKHHEVQDTDIHCRTKTEKMN